MASRSYQKVRAALVDERDAVMDDHKLTCIDLIQKIDEIHQAHTDEAMSFEAALMLTIG